MYHEPNINIGRALGQLNCLWCENSRVEYSWYICAEYLALPTDDMCILLVLYRIMGAVKMVDWGETQYHVGEDPSDPTFTKHCSILQIVGYKLFK